MRQEQQHQQNALALPNERRENKERDESAAMKERVSEAKRKEKTSENLQPHLQSA